MPQKNSSSYGEGVGALVDEMDVVVESVVDEAVVVLGVTVAFEEDSDNDAANSSMPDSVEFKLAELVCGTGVVLVSGTGVVLVSGTGVVTDESPC